MQGVCEMEENAADILSTPTFIETNPVFKEIREGFDSTNPLVGTITHEFTFKTDPWELKLTTGLICGVLDNIRFSLSKVFNQNNTTETFFVLSMGAKFDYWGVRNPPFLKVKLFDVNGAELFVSDFGDLGAKCGPKYVMTKRDNVDSKYFDRVKSAVVWVSGGGWKHC